MTQVFSFLIGVFGEALVFSFVSKIKYWWANYVSEEMKVKADETYSQIFPESQDMGKPNPPTDDNPDTKA